MNVNRLIKVREKNPVASLQAFLGAWWRQYGLDAILAPVELMDGSGVVTQVVDEPARLVEINPFAPVMLENSALIASCIIQRNPGKRLAFMLRPCELRAFMELGKRRSTPFDQQAIVILGVDCLGTFPAAEYRQRVAQQGSASLTQQVLEDAAEGGLRTHRYRTACQICDWPGPRGADITIGVIGVDTQCHLLVSVRDEKTDQRLGLEVVSPQLANEPQVVRRETLVGAVADMRGGVRRMLIEKTREGCRFDEFGKILAWLANCTLCGECLEACPLYSGEFSIFSTALRAGPADERRKVPAGRAPLADLVQFSRWLTSCAGCGMCEERCKHNVPLILLISALSHRIQSEIHYTSGDPVQHLPWLTG